MATWHRQPVLWLAIALPLAAVLAGIWMIRRAAGPLDASPDPVRKLAQIQTTDDARDRRALALGLRGELQFDGDQVVVQFAHEQPGLYVDLVHATDARQDRRLELHACGAARWCADARLPDARFNIALSATNADWRIVGKRERSQTHAPLQSALAPR